MWHILGASLLLNWNSGQPCSLLLDRSTVWEGEVRILNQYYPHAASARSLQEQDDGTENKTWQIKGPSALQSRPGLGWPEVVSGWRLFFASSHHVPTRWNLIKPNERKKMEILLKIVIRRFTTEDCTVSGDNISWCSWASENWALLSQGGRPLPVWILERK